MKKGKFLAGFLAVCTVAALATVNASASSTSWRLYQHKGAPTSDDVTVLDSYDILSTQSYSYICMPSCNFSSSENYVFYESAAFVGELTFAGDSERRTNPSGLQGTTTWVHIELETNGSAETNTASGSFSV